MVTTNNKEMTCYDLLVTNFDMSTGGHKKSHNFCFSCLNWKLHDLHGQKWQTQKKSLFPVINQLQPARRFGLRKKRNT